jgi:hypothetical protein
MKRSGWPVTPESGPAPAGRPDECFYCKMTIGSEHAPDCVLRKRTVVCRVSVDFVRVVPESWTADDIAFAMNESSSCANNFLEELKSLVDRLGEHGCLCSRTEGVYLREADEADEEADQLGIDPATG